MPTALSRSTGPARRVLLVGGCAFDAWAGVLTALDPTIEMDLLLFAGGVDVAAQLVRPLSDYDLAIVQVQLRAVVADSDFFVHSFAATDAYEGAFARAEQMLGMWLPQAIDALAALPVMVMNYPVPQQSGLGRMLPRYDLRNPTFFIEKLNRVLARMIAGRPAVHLLDAAQLAATIGRLHVQDDGFMHWSHGGLIGDGDNYVPGVRLEPFEPLSRRIQFRKSAFIEAAWAEANAILRTVSRVDAVKMVCVDLDDTMWRGVAAEQAEIDPDALVEGWPLGFAEALMMLKRRGIILAIVSKNDPARVESFFDGIFLGRLTLKDFAIRKIGWEPKAEGVARAIADANILPESVVFIDDNPVERAAVTAAFPAIRTLGAPHLDWRRILLWSAETQVPYITGESARRSEMIAAQVDRERTRGALSPADFLADLQVRVTMRAVRDGEAAAFPRAFELVNKTNQFNTTGRRWSREEAETFLAGGGTWWTFNVVDRFTDYGLVGVVLLRAGVIEQFVMSCRVFGLGVEAAVLARLTEDARAGDVALVARLVKTDRNGPCQNVYRNGGWDRAGDGWSAPAVMTVPPHVELSVDSERDDRPRAR